MDGSQLPNFQTNWADVVSNLGGGSPREQLFLRPSFLLPSRLNISLSSLPRLYGNGSDVTGRGGIVPEVTPCILWQRK